MAKAVRRETGRAKAKKPTVTRVQVKSIEYQYIGDEPIDVKVKGYTSALNWYTYQCDTEQAREWLFEYMKRSEEYSKQDIAFARKAPKSYFPTTIGWIARMLMNGNILDNEVYFRTKVREVIGRGKADTPEAAEVKDNVVSIQDRVRAKSNQLIADIEGELDDNASLNIYDYLKGREATVAAANAVKAYYQPQLDEAMLDDEQVKEAFGKKLAARRKFWQQFIDDCDRFVGNTKAVKVRKPREKKAKSAVDLTKTLKFQKEFPELKIVSINPAEIIGAQNLWLYNTSRRKLTQLTAIGPSGLSVKGTSIIGFDPEKSVTKTVRKPELTVSALLAAGKVGLRKFMEELKTNATEANGRMNLETVLLRAQK